MQGPAVSDQVLLEQARQRAGAVLASLERDRVGLVESSLEGEALAAGCMAVDGAIAAVRQLLDGLSAETTSD